MSSKSPKKGQKPSVPLSKIPGVKEICEFLGFQSASIKDTEKFLETTRAFRKSYEPSAGSANVNLLLWKDPLVQYEYKNMAEIFLTDGDNSDKYWGSKRHWYSAGLQYPDDADRIVALLMQLFYKQTRYAFNNLQYGHKQSDARDGSRDNTTPSSEIFPQHRPTPSSSTIPSDSQDSRISGKSPGRQVIAGHEKMSASSLPQSSGSGSTAPPEYAIYDGPEDFDDYIRRPFDVLCAEDQPPAAAAATSSSANPRKRKKKTNVEPRRSGRKPVPTYIPGVIIQDEYEALFESSSNESNSPIADTTEMDYTFERDSSVEIMSVSDRNLDQEGAAGGASSSGSAAGKPFKAPTAPMMSAASKPTSPGSKAKIPRRPTSSKTPEKRKSATADVPTTEMPAPRTKIVKLNMPSSKAQAKPLGKKVEARKTSFEGKLPAAQTFVPPQQRVESMSGGAAKGSQNTPSAGGAETGLAQATRADVSSTPTRDLSRTHSPRRSGTSDETLELGDDAAERAVNPSTEREAQPYAVIPDNASFSRTRLADPIPSMAVPAPSSTIASAPVGMPPQAAVDVQPIVSPHVPEPAPEPAPTATTAAQPPPVKQSSTPTPAPASANVPKSKPQIPLWVITRTPHPTEELWDNGKLTGQTLPSFLTSLSLLTSRPADSINKIIFTLRTPISNTKIGVGREAEDGWTRVMETFRGKLREVAPKGRSLSEVCSILIEPVWEDVGFGGEEGGEGVEDVDF